MLRQTYERHLPHQVPAGHPIFLTWNLKGAFPREAVERMRQKREEIEREPSRAGESIAERRLRHDKLLFALADHFLDRATKGPLHLKDARAAKVVETALVFGVPERYALFAWCVMANHVHALIEPVWELAKVTQGIKGYTARSINALQRNPGRVFWQDESYDHWARDEAEVMRIIAYIEKNPVTAGLCARPEDWLWSSARLREDWPSGQPFPSRSGFPA